MRVTLGPRQMGVLVGLFVLQGGLLFGMCLYVLHQSGPSLQMRVDDLQAQLNALRQSSVLAAHDHRHGPPVPLHRPKTGYFEHNSSYVPQHKDSVIVVMAKTNCEECNFQGWSDNCVFVHSLRRTGFKGDVVFFVNNINERLAKEFDSFNVSYIVTEGRYNLDGYDLEAVGLGAKPRADVLNLHSSVFRYLLYDLFLRDYGHYYNRVMFTDVRDVLFQLDPFVWNDHPQWGEFEDKLYFFGEDVHNDGGWNSEMYYQVFGRVPPPEVGSKAVLCSGTTMASVAKARLYLSVLLPLLGQVPDHLFGYDQAIHNHIIYTGLLPADSFKIFHNRAGPVRTVGLESDLPQPTHGGLILLPDGSIVNVVHQWTRISMYDNGCIKQAYDCPLQSVGY